MAEQLYVTRCQRFFAAGCAAWAIGPCGAAMAPGGPLIQVSEPRAFGYTVGDVVQRRITIELPADLDLDEASWPDSRQRGRAIELRGLSRHPSPWLSPRRQAWTLEYQVLGSAVDVRTLELPPITLRFISRTGGAGTTSRIDAWPVTVSPLTQPDARQREGLGEWRPDQAPPRVDTTAVHQRLSAYAVLALLPLAYLAAVYLWWPWWSARRRPFGAAWRALGRPSAAVSPDQRVRAFRTLHQAINQTAGRVVFEADVARFVAEHPQFGALRSDLAAFFQHSREQFFAIRDEREPGPGAADASDSLGLVWRLCRACRDAERGAA
ncbi:hypothetical protein AACH06_02950 [Ideonella sp. DXS29W]|uniref:MxaA protein n=1 Tax=Ideonella lacteola TaxID=2984193 RepID=A0ABU9BIH4_9BURK